MNTLRHFARLALALLCAVAPLRAQSNVGESAAFAFDTRDYTTGLAAESATFAFDTRLVDGLGGADVSGTFSFNTRDLNFTGLAQSVAGVPLGGVMIKLMRSGTIFWQGTTGLDGTFSPGLAPANYTINASKAGYLTLLTNVAGSAGGNGTLTVVLIPMPPAPLMFVLNRLPGLMALNPPASDAPVMKVFYNGSFVTRDPNNPTLETTLYPNRATVVLTHGMSSNPDAWATDLAMRIKNLNLATPLNIVAWDWHGPAAKFQPPFGVPIGAACDQGELLGKALHQALGTGYSQRLHFVGHSLGAIVNCLACNYAHGRLPEAAGRTSPNPPSHWDTQQTQPHITLLDEAELASINGSQVITATEIGAFVAGLKGAVTAGAQAVVRNWKSPIPEGAAWIDSYISMVGVQRPQAVNVCLLKPAFSLMNPIDAHGYAHSWYRDSVNLAGSPTPVPPAIGYRLSREFAQTFPPTGTGTSAGSVWYENVNTPDPLDLVNQPNPQDYECNAFILSAYAVLSGVKITSELAAAYEVEKARVIQAGVAAGNALINAGNRYIYQPLDSVGRAVLDGYEAGMNMVSNAGRTFIYKSGVVVSETREKIGNLWDATQDYARDFANSLNADYSAPGSLILPGSVYRLQSKPAPALAGFTDATAAQIPAGVPAYMWMTVNVPANAGMMAFDFTVTGDPLNDRIVCAVNDQNVFSLAAKFVPDGVPGSSELIDVSPYAGQSMELFFGLAGGTSTNCEVAIDGIRFITLPTPKVGIANAGPNGAVKWPAAATGWVLEYSDTLAPDGWQPMAMTAATVDQGVATVEEPVSGPKRFYRLRRGP